MAREYNADSIVSIRNDRDRLRRKPSMFIPSTYKDGAIHIIFEIIDNSVDELSIENTVGTTLNIVFDTKTKEVTVTDDGRGIPHEALLDVCTVLNTSGKFDNDENTAYTYSGGTFGVGFKTAVFLSKTCEVTSIRGGKSLTYRFKDGLLVDTVKSKAKGHGTITRFTIDQKIIDINAVEPEDIKNRLYEKSFCFPDITMNLTIIDGEKDSQTITYVGNTLLDLVKRWKPDTEVISINCNRKVRFLGKIDDDKITESKVIIDAALSFKDAALEADTDAYVVSYANSIKTYDGGTHVEGLKQGLIKYFKEVVIPKFGKKDQGLNILPTDITSGLCGMVSVKITRPEFSAQHKSKLTNPEVRIAVRDAVFDALCEEKSSVTSMLVDFVKRVARGRLASKKVRKKDTDNAFSQDKPDKFTPLIKNMKTTHSELIIAEGDSAAGLIVSARDPYNQAVYSIRKPKNVFDMSSDAVIRDTVNNFNELMSICNIEPGPKCDPSKCVYDTIWMLSDGDTDGDGIATTVFGLFGKHCKPIVDAGMLGRILPPLYSYKDGKKKKFVQSKRKFLNLVTDRFLDDVTVKFNGKVMSRKQLSDFLDINQEYDVALNKLADWYCCDPKLMEYIVWKYHGTAVDQKKSTWMANLKSEYPDIKVLLENKTIVLDGEIAGKSDDYINLALDVQFYDRMKKFKRIQSINRQITGYELNGTPVTIYEMMTKFRKYIPKDVKYYKGLGELTVDEMSELCLDPEKRTGIIVKFKDYEEDMRKLSIILSGRKEYSDMRMEILGSTVLSDEDLAT